MPSPFHPLQSKIKKKAKKKTKKINTKSPNQTLNPQIQIQILSESEEEENEVGFKLKPSSCSQTHTIQPLGNFLLTSSSSKPINIRNRGLGNLHVLADDILLDLLGLLGPRSLAVLSAASKSLYVFATHDPLWRALVLRHLGGDFTFAGSWRSTFASTLTFHSTPCSGGLPIRDFYSDYLFQSWLCANLEMKPEWLERDSIPRRRQGISVEEFVSCFEELNKPVLIEGCVDSWPALGKWSKEHLVRVCGDVKFAAGPVEMTMDSYFRYSDLAKEERPLYLFDPKFVEKVPELVSDYEVPVYFREDLFSVLGDERPDFRWVIIGPAGSGSSFHVDPNSTSAWNAVIKGSKKWVMFPPEVVPPGVHPSPDGAEVACPVSIMEWFMNFYGACMDWKRRPVECVCKAGDVVFVPNGWWHLVINLEDSIAITQNYVSSLAGSIIENSCCCLSFLLVIPSPTNATMHHSIDWRNLLNVLDFLKKPNASELVSGTKDRVNLHDKFKTAIEAALPGTIDQLTVDTREKMIAQQKKQSFWESATDANVGGFKFFF